jgi:sugar lactone lactonase YvrE
MNQSLCLFIVLLLLNQCFSVATSVRQAPVVDEFDVQSIQAWSPGDLVVDSNGHIWFINSLEPDCIVHIDHNGVLASPMRTEPPSNILSLALGGPHELLHIVDKNGRRVVRMTLDGVQVDALDILIPSQDDVGLFKVDSHGTMYMVEMSAQIWRMDINGKLLSSFVTDPVVTPTYLAIDRNDVLYTGSVASSTIYQLSRNGIKLESLSALMVSA